MGEGMKVKGLLIVTAIVGAVSIATAWAFLQPRQFEGSPDNRNVRNAELHGLEANLSLEELTSRVPLVVEATVNSRALVPSRDDSFLPKGLTEGGRKLVDAGYQRIKWDVSVDTWVKGESAHALHVVRGINGDEVSLSGDAEFSEIAAGGRFKLWLEPDDWFGQNHFVLVEALPLP